MITTLTLLAVLLPQQPEALAAAVDLPTTVARAAAVDGLLQQSQDVAAWLAICRGFGTFAPLTAGPSKHEVALQVLDQVEPTELHLYVPSAYDPAKPAPLLLWLHGSGGSGAREHLAWQQVADAVGMLVLSPTDAHAGRGYSKEPRERAAALAALRWARRQANVDENAVFVGGWSRGGTLAWDLALRHTDLFAGALPMIGGPLLEPGESSNMRHLENVVSLPLRDLQGSQDDPVLLQHLHLAFEHLHKWRAADAELIEFGDRGHDADLGAVDWARFFALRRTARPTKVVRVAADLGEARSAWLQVTSLDRRVSVAGMPQVPAARWNTLDDVGRRRLLFDIYQRGTARLEVDDKGGGKFVAKGEHVVAFSLWLEREQLGKDGKVEVRFDNKPKRLVATPSARTLLQHFVEHFDRTRLPVVRVDVP